MPNITELVTTDRNSRPNFYIPGKYLSYLFTPYAVKVVFYFRQHSKC